MATQPQFQIQTEDSEGSGYLMVRSDRIVRFDEQPRTHFSEESIAELADSIEEEGQNQPVQLCRNRIKEGMKSTSRNADGANAPFKLIDGERRWRACQLLAKRKEQPFFMMKATIEIVADEAEHFRKSFSANFGHEEMVPLDIALGLLRIKENEPGVTYEGLAKRYQKSVAYVIQYLSLNNLCDEVRQMMNPDVPKRQRLNVSNAIQIAKVRNPALQLRFANEALENGLSVADVKDVVEGAALKDRSHTVRTIADFEIPSGGFPSGRFSTAIEHRGIHHRGASSARAVFSRFINATEPRMASFVRRSEDGTFNLEEIYLQSDDGDELFASLDNRLRSIIESCNALRDALQEAKE